MGANNLGLIFARTLVEARKTLLRGFTTIRDIGGDTVGVKAAIDQGVAEGRTFNPSQAMISQTSGHGDAAYRTTRRRRSVVRPHGPLTVANTARVVFTRAG